MSGSPSDFNARIIEEFRSNAGRVGPPFEGTPLLLLHHTGARSGKTYVNPLAYLRDGDRYVVFASKGGAPNHPAWYHNLKAHPEVEAEVGTETLSLRASEAQGQERDRLFSTQAGRSPAFADYQEKAGNRLIPVMVLAPR
jgi:deazaflavin-dependent oxidoreductase (nitroreductase family)